MNTDLHAALRTSWKLLVRHLGGGEATASCTRVLASRISEYGSAGSGRFVPLDVVLDAELVAGEPIVTRAMARMQGFALVPVTARGPGRLADEMSRIGRDVGDLFGNAAQALAGEKVPPARLGQMIADIEDLQSVLPEALATLQALAARGDATTGAGQ